MDSSIFFKSRRRFLIDNIFPRAAMNTQYNSINDVKYYFRIKKYIGCFCSLRGYPVNIIVNETSNHSLWKKFALFISNVINHCSYSDYYIIRRANIDSEFKLPYHRVKICLISYNTKIQFILTIDSSGLSYNMNFRKHTEYNELFKYLNNM